MKGITLLALALGAASLASCDYAPSNVQTLVTSDCGQTWKVIKTGTQVPKMVGMCEYKVTLPDYPMQGESTFKVQFAGRVMAGMNVSYDYSIVDAALFIGEAKYLGKRDRDADDAAMDRAFETAENSVIDKRIKNVVSRMLEQTDIVEFSASEFEDKLLDAVNVVLKERGIKLNTIDVVPLPDKQTAQAIDVATAMKIYKSKDLDEVGKAVIAASAGATTITTTVEAPKAAEEKK